MSNLNTRRLVLSAVFTALIAGSSFFTIPAGPVPVVLTTMFVLLSGMLGGPVTGLISVSSYLLLGLLGLPVFAGATGGAAKFLGPTGGYLIGYLPAAAAGGLLFSNPQQKGCPAALRFLQALGAALLGGALIYVPGLLWLKHSLSADWPAVLKAGLLPFIPGYVIKSAAGAALAFSLKDSFAGFLHPKHCE